MQKKIMYSFIALCIAASAAGQQQPVYMVTTNNTSLTGNEAPFAIAISPDKSATSFNVYVQNQEKRKIELQIVHPLLGVLADTSFSSDQFKCRYNFDQLEDGRYQVVLSSGKFKLVKDFEINTETKRSLVLQ